MRTILVTRHRSLQPGTMAGLVELSANDLTIPEDANEDIIALVTTFGGTVRVTMDPVLVTQ